MMFMKCSPEIFTNFYETRQFTHISGHPSAAGQAQDRESSPVKDQRSTTVPRNEPI